MFSHNVLVRNYQSKLPWEKLLIAYKNMTSRTGSINTQTLIFSYNPALIILYKPNAAVILMTLWVKIV